LGWALFFLFASFGRAFSCTGGGGSLLVLCSGCLGGLNSRFGVVGGVVGRRGGGGSGWFGVGGWRGFDGGGGW